MPSQIAGVQPSRSGGSAMLIMRANARCPERRGRGPGGGEACVGRAPCVVRGAPDAPGGEAGRRSAGIVDSPPRRAVTSSARRASSGRSLAEADDHRHAARAGQHRDVARLAAGGQRDAARARPVEREKADGGEIVGGEHDRSGRRARRAMGAEQPPQHPLAEVAQVGGAGAEIGVLGGLVVGDLRAERAALQATSAGAPSVDRSDSAGSAQCRRPPASHDLECDNVGRPPSPRRAGRRGERCGPGAARAAVRARRSCAGAARPTRARWRPVAASRPRAKMRERRRQGLRGGAEAAQAAARAAAIGKSRSHQRDQRRDRRPRVCRLRPGKCSDARARRPWPP